jgi:hypothetical protein
VRCVWTGIAGHDFSKAVERWVKGRVVWEMEGWLRRVKGTERVSIGVGGMVEMGMGLDSGFEVVDARNFV